MHQRVGIAPERREILLEFFVVFLLLVAPSLVAGAWYLAAPWEPNAQSLHSQTYGFVFDLGSLALLLYLARRNQGSLQVVGLRPTRWWREILWGLLAAWVAWFVPRYASVLTFILGLEPWTDELIVEDEAFLNASLPAFLLVSAFVEETLFRAYLWNRLVDLTGRPLVSLIVCAGLFSLAHTASPSILVQHFVTGVLFGAFYWIGRSTPRLVLAHWAINLVVLYTAAVPAFVDVPVKDPSYLSLRPLNSAPTDVYVDEVLAPSNGQRHYASREVLLDLTHVRCGSAVVVSCGTGTDAWCVQAVLTVEGKRRQARWTGARIGEAVGFFAGGDLVMVAFVTERSARALWIGPFSRHEAQGLRDAIAAGGAR